MQRIFGAWLLVLEVLPYTGKSDRGTDQKKWLRGSRSDIFLLHASAYCFPIERPPPLGLRSGSPRAHLYVVGMSLSNPACPLFKIFYFFLLFCVCVYFCLYGPLKLIWFHKFSRQLSVFSLCSSGLISVLLVLSSICNRVHCRLIYSISICSIYSRRRQTAGVRAGRSLVQCVFLSVWRHVLREKRMM